MVSTTTRQVGTMLEMFADATTGEVYHEGGMVTRETESGNVALIAYGWMKLAEYDEQEGVITVFNGFQSVGSTTVTRWLRRLNEVGASRGRTVEISERSPTIGKPNEGAKFIGEYINDYAGASPVEQSAVELVHSSLARIL